MEMNNGVAEGETQKPRPFGHLKDSEWSRHFTYHKPNESQIPRYNAINEAAKKFAEVICENVPSSADRTAALRMVVNTKMTCNSYIATNPEQF